MQQTPQVIIDLGTTGIAFAIIDSNDQNPAIYSPNEQTAKVPINSKEPTTLHIFANNDEQIFDNTSIMQRAYFGDRAPSSVLEYTNNHSGIDYQFHGLKTYIYQLQNLIHPTNDSRKVFDALEVFKVALMLIKRSIDEIRKDKHNDQSKDMHIIFLVPANSSGSLMEHLKQPIVEVFDYLKQYTDNLEQWLTFIKEPVAASQYAINEIIKIGGRELETHDGHDYSNIAIIDMGGGTCDFNLIRYFSNQKDIKKKFQPQGKSMACFAGGYFMDQNFLQFLSQMLPTAHKQGGQSVSFALNPVEINKVLAEFIQKKKEFKTLDDTNCEFQVNIPESFVGDFEGTDGIFKDVYNENQIPCASTGEFTVPQKVFKICFDEEFVKIDKFIISFFKEAAKNDHIDYIIVVGGLTESSYVHLRVIENLNKLYQKFGSNSGLQTDVRTITTPSIAIIKGAIVLYQNDQEAFQTSPQFTAQESVFYNNNNILIPIYEQGQAYERANQHVPFQNNNNENVEIIVKKFNETTLQVERIDTLSFKVNTDGNNCQLLYDCSQGHTLSVVNQDGKQQKYKSIELQRQFTESQQFENIANQKVNISNEKNSDVKHKQLDAKNESILENQRTAQLQQIVTNQNPNLKQCNDDKVQMQKAQYEIVSQTDKKPKQQPDSTSKQVQWKEQPDIQVQQPANQNAASTQQFIHQHDQINNHEDIKHDQIYDHEDATQIKLDQVEDQNGQILIARIQSRYQIRDLDIFSKDLIVQSIK